MPDNNEALVQYFSNPGYELLFGQGNNQLNPVERFQESPGYQFQLDEGSRNLQRNLASRGLLESGNAMKELQNYGQGLANQEYGNWQNAQNSLFNNYQNQLLGLSQFGSQFSGIPEAYNLGNQNAQFAYGTGQSLANLGQQYGQNLSSLFANQAPFYGNLFMNTAAAKAQNFGNNYAMNMQQQNNAQASNAGNQTYSSMFGGGRF